MSGRTFELATLLRASAALHEARTELLEIEGIDQEYGEFVDHIDVVRNTIIDRVEAIEAQLVVECGSLDARLRCTTTTASVGACEQLPLESLGNAEAAE